MRLAAKHIDVHVATVSGPVNKRIAWGTAVPAQCPGVRTSADEDDVALEDLRLAALGGLQSQLHAVSGHLAADDLGVELKLETLLRQRALEGLPHVSVLRRKRWERDLSGV